MINAEKANETARDQAYQALKKQEAEIEEAILEAAEDGSFGCTVFITEGYGAARIFQTLLEKRFDYEVKVFPEPDDFQHAEMDISWGGRLV